MEKVKVESFFYMQNKLECKIQSEKNLGNKSFLKEDVVGFCVELGELLNEWQGFKYWKKNNKPRIVAFNTSNGYINHSDFGLSFYNPLLYEYVDVLHFLLTIGLKHGLDGKISEVKLGHEKLTDVNDIVIKLFSYANVLICKETNKNEIWSEMFSLFVRLGQLLELTWENIKVGYMQKHRINYLRQENFY